MPKISELPAGTLPLAATESVPVVQGTSTVRVPASAVRAVALTRISASGAYTLGTAHENGLIVCDHTSGEALWTIPAETTWNPPIGTSVTIYNMEPAGTVRIQSYSTDFTVHALHPIPTTGTTNRTFTVSESTSVTITKFKANAWFVDGGYVAS